MALNLDDLIGSMQHVHAGDRGQGIEEMRENLRTTLGQQALGPGFCPAQPGSSSMGRNVSSSSSTSTNGFGGSNAHQRRKQSRNVHAPQNSYRDDSIMSEPRNGAAAPSTSYSDPDATMMQGDRDEFPHFDGSEDESSSRHLAINDYGHHSATTANTTHNLYGQSFNSAGSYNTSGSSVSGAGSSGFGWNAQAPANTPQQSFGGDWMQNSKANAQHLPCVAEASSVSPPLHDQDGSYDRASSSSPRKLVNGFHPSPPSGLHHHHHQQPQQAPPAW